MSRTSVRTGIATYLGGTYDTLQRVYRPSPVSKVGTVRDAFPKRMSEEEFMPSTLGVGVRSGAVLIVHLEREREHRLTVPSVQGVKKVTYDICLHIYLLSKAGHAEDAQSDLDLLVDSLRARMEADPTLGGAVFEAMETPYGVQVDYGEPVTKADRTETYCAFRFQANEYVTA